MKIKNKKFTALLNLKLHKVNGKCPDVIVKLNGTPIQITDVTKIWLDSTFGENQIDIIFSNKLPNDTIVGNDGKILEDLAVEIDSFIVDNIDLTYEIKKYNRFITISGVTSTFGYMYTNGTLEYRFECPGFYHKRNINILRQG